MIHSASHTYLTVRPPSTVLIRRQGLRLGLFGDATVRRIGRASDAACKELKDTGQPDVVHEVMVKRIIAAARRGERNVTRLRDAALTGLRNPRNQIRG